MDYDKEKDVIEKIQPLLNAIRDICQKSDIPYVVSFGVKREGENVTMLNAMYANGNNAPSTQQLAAWIMLSDKKGELTNAILTRYNETLTKGDKAILDESIPTDKTKIH